MLICCSSAYDGILIITYWYLYARTYMHICMYILNLYIRNYVVVLVFPLVFMYLRVCIVTYWYYVGISVYLCMHVDTMKYIDICSLILMIFTCIQ